MMMYFPSNRPLLRSNFIPDEKEAAQIHGVMASQRAILTDLDNNILHLRKVLQNLEAQHSFVSDALAVNGALFSPVRRLFPEILAEIFQHCVPPRTRSESSRARCCPSVVPLLQVCHRWRVVVHGTPQLWNDVTIYGPEDIPYASLCLRNSRSLPLHISIRHAYENGGDSQKHIDLQKCPGFVEVLSRKIPFLRSLEYSGALRGLDNLFPPGNSTKHSPLEHLFLDVDLRATDSKLPSFTTATQLRTLTLHDGAVHLIPSLTPTPHLTQFSLKATDRFPTGPLYTFLRLSPGLTELTIHSDKPIPFDLTSDELVHPIPLPALRTLEIDCDSNGFGLINLLRTPVLRAAVLRFDPYDWEAVRMFLSYVRASLRQLSLAFLNMSPRELAESMKPLTELETLKVLDECAPWAGAQGLWVSLTPEEGAPHSDWICPKLARVDIRKASLGDKFVKFVRGRTEPPTVGCEVDRCFDINLRACTIDNGDLRALQELQLEREGLSIVVLPELS